jgi:outer membrane receptor protein involved in Fe transport
LNGNGILFVVGCRGGTVEGSNDSSRDQLRGSVSWFSGKHELKGGVAYRSLDNESVFRRPAASGGPLIDENGLVVDSDGVVGGSFSLRPGFYSLTELDQDSHGETEEWSLFVQDQWRVTPHLSVNLGVRLDSFEATGDASERLGNSKLDFDFDEMIGPRLGFVWDATRNGRSKLFGQFGRFYESVPLAINTLAFGQFGINLYFFLYPQDGSLPSYDNLGAFLFPFSLGLGELVDPNTNPMYTDEYILGFEYEVRRDLAVGITAVSRELGSVVEDISLDGGETFFLTNPGGTYVINPATGDALVEPVVFPSAVREYKSIELTLNKRYTSNWQLFSSYVYSENEGNYGGLFRQDTGLNAPHITGAFDGPEMLEGAFGPLPNDRTHHFKVYGSYNWPFRLVTGFFGQYMSGTPISKFGFDEFGNAERFVTPRGTEGRTPDLAHLDLHLAYPIDLPSSLELQVIADIFNVTNQQSATVENQIWTFAERQRTVDPGECGGPGTGPGTSCPEGNPLWGSAIAFQPPRSLRIGLKLSW